MNQQPSRVTPWILLFAVSTLPACSTRTASERRIEREPDVYARIPEEQREQVRRGAVTKGMSQDAVRLAWGKPDRVREGMDEEGRETESWLYFDYEGSGGRTFGSGAEGATGSPGGFSAYPSVGYNSGGEWSFGATGEFDRVAQREVKFVDGHVVSWNRNP